jgi:hypothetical protein
VEEIPEVLYWAKHKFLLAYPLLNDSCYQENQANLEKIMTISLFSVYTKNNLKIVFNF